MPRTRKSTSTNVVEEVVIPAPKKRGRPLGSKNKPKTPVSTPKPSKTVSKPTAPTSAAKPVRRTRKATETTAVATKTVAVKKVRRPRVPRVKKIKLTVIERTMLRYPPTPTTWRCDNMLVRDVDTTQCGNINSGKTSECWVCGYKPTEPVLVWPDYLEACRKVNNEPGTLWYVTDERSKRVLVRKDKELVWKEIEAPEGVAL